MTTSRRGRGLLAVSAVSAAAVVLAMTAGGADAAQKPGGADAKKPAQADKQTSGKERKGNYDARTPNAKTTYARTAKVQGKETAASKKFRDSLGAQGVVEVDPNTGTPAQVTKLNGFLTGKSAKKATDVTLGYVKAHPEIFKLSDADLATLKLRKDYVDDLGTHHIFWTQVVDGVEVFGNGLKSNVTKNGQLISVMGSPVSGLTTAAQARSAEAAPKVSAAGARSAAIKDVGGTAKSATATTSGVNTKWSNGDTAQQVWFHTADGLQKGWLTYTNSGGQNIYSHVVDAQTGATLYRKDLVSEGNGDALVQDYYPGAAKGGTQRTENLIYNKWLPKNAKTLLDGTSVAAFADVNDDNQPNPGETVKVPGTKTGSEYKLTTFQNASSFCSAAFICTWDPAKPDSWKTNMNQDVTNAFYLASNFHDWLAKPPISFTPAAGSFDAAGGDPVMLNALDGAATAANGGPDANHIDNANMSTPPDGQSPTMQMYLWHFPGTTDEQEGYVPSSGANDASILYHEYTHGLSNRLVVDATGNSTLNSIQAGSMGEAWSDFYAMDYLVSHGLEKDTTAPGEVLEGRYVSHGELFRTQAIDCRVKAVSPNCIQPDGSKGGYTYADFPTIGGTPEVHASGEVWAQTLWDLRERFGRSYAMSIITRAMELSPADPTMLDMRNAIVQADLVASGGKNADTIWTVFANRGMGWYAGVIDGGDSFPAEDFHKPPTGATTTLTGTVKDKDTGAPVAGALVYVGGHSSGYAGDYAGTTDANGNYAITGVAPGTYPKLVMSAPGYELLVQPATVKPGAKANFAPRRNWAASSGGGTVADFNGPDFSPQCGPGFAIDNAQGTGWGSTTGDDAGTPTNTMIEKHIDIKLPAKVNVSGFNIDPSNTCGDPGSASTGGYRVETSADGTTWAVAASGTFDATNRGKYNLVAPTGNATGVQYVRFVMTSPQVPDFKTNCPDGAFGGCQFTDMTEIQVFGKK
ncbi:F5/8 type C domain-containing protein [Kribbella rubisoli]|uniref:F5/8 type C domain-containing protein n=1 Tax=Kribbella rubisoli TaxID=3075929 RepID=A0A4Q7XBJ9_9ACTN|nr:M36 family metallopeptidase [Kribbella rubisoli]RZU20253.1 F5/8 type C domain-containing protein [Kribbella rubisoli]